MMKIFTEIMTPCIIIEPGMCERENTHKQIILLRSSHISMIQISFLIRIIMSCAEQDEFG